MWSSPRNLSTALMYSWRQRPDTTVVDEPLYAHYLRVSGRLHPGRNEVLASQDQDGQSVVENVVLGSYKTPVVFFKQMAKHLVDIDRAFLDSCHNVLLTRDPLDMLTSLQQQLPDATLEDTGFEELVEILSVVEANGSSKPMVIDSKVLLLDPRSVLTELCDGLGVPFDERMMQWPAGPKPEDGVWAKYWYEAVHQSTGWSPWSPKPDEILPHLQPVLCQAMECYEALLPYRIG